MSTISLCMIVKNEEDVIERCLNSIKNVVDEIIIVDTGSTDRTKEICSKFTNKIFNFNWCDDFSKARNYSFSLATSEYIMWLDADDVVPKKSILKLKKLKSNLTSETYMLKYDIAFYNNKPTFSYFRERIIKNCDLAKWSGCVHECITPFGKIERLNISIEHQKTHFKNSDRNINIYKKILKTRQLNPREQYYYGRELFDHKKYKQCIKVLNNFIDSGKGWVENIIDSCYIISKCYFNLNYPEKQLQYLLKTFNYDTPRSNITCMIGDYFLLKQNYNLSIYWYLLSVNNKYRTINNGFVENMYYNYYPYLQLCLCYYKCGDLKKSEYYNNLADKYMSTITTVKNKEFFNNLKEKGMLN